MTPFVAAMRARPAEFRRTRSTAYTALGAVIALGCLAWLVWAVIDFPALRDYLTYEGSRPRYQAWALLAPALSVPAAVLGLVLGARWAIRPNGHWEHLPNGCRVRSLGTFEYDADQPMIDRFSAALATGQSGMFLPLPAPQGRGTVVIEFWAADEDRVAWAMMSTSTEPVALDGESYLELVDAESRGALVARQTTPLASAVPLEAPTALDESYWYDIAFAARTLQRGRVLTIVCTAVLAVCALAIVWGVADLRHLAFLVFGLVVGVAALSALAVARVGYSNSRNAFGRLSGTLLRLGPSGLSLETLPGLAWSEIALIAVYDRRNSLAENPLSYRDLGTKAAAQELGRSAGAGTVSIALVLRDGEAARSRVVGAPARSVVALGRHRADGPRRGWVLFTPDSLLPISTVEHLVQSLRQQADGLRIPLVVTTRAREFRDAIAAVRDGAPEVARRP